MGLCDGPLRFTAPCLGRSAAGNAAKDAASSAFESVANAFGEAAESVLKEVTTVWTRIPSSSVVQTDTIGLLQSDLRAVTTLVAGVALIVATVRLAISKKGEDAAVIGFGLLRLVVVSSAGLAILNLSLLAGDEFSQYILDRSTEGQFGGGTSFGLVQLTNPALIFLFGFFGILTGVIQIGVLLVRSASLVILAAAWPIAAAASMHPSGEMIWKKITAWLVSFVLYKPIAAMCYAAAFRLLNDATGDVSLLAVIQGLLLLVLAVLALPATIRLLMPVANGMSLGPSAAGVAAGMAATAGTVATGAVMLGDMAGGATGAVTSGGSAGGPMGAITSGDTGDGGSGGGLASSVGEMANSSDSSSDE